MKTLDSFLVSVRRLALVAGFTMGPILSAQVSVTWQAAIDFGLGDSLGTPLAAGNLVKLGTFTIDNATIQAHAGDFTYLSSNFVTVDTAAVGDGTGVDGYWASVANVSTDSLGVGGAHVYLWAFNSATGATATQQGIFTSSLATWTFPGDTSLPATTQIELNEVNSIIIGSQGPSTFNLAPVPSAVPEPATTAVFAAFGALALAVGRRRFVPQRLVRSRQL